MSPRQVTKSAILTRLRASGPSACQLERHRAGLSGPFDDHGFAAGAPVGSGAADDRRDLPRRRGVEELDRDLTPRKEERDLAGRLRRCQARKRADAAVVADLPALRVEQRVGDNPLVAQTRPLLTDVDFHIVECTALAVDSPEKLLIARASPGEAGNDEPIADKLQAIDVQSRKVVSNMQFELGGGPKRIAIAKRAR